jgi:outer membrane receptor protein involved in Fe transport
MYCTGIAGACMVVAISLAAAPVALSGEPDETVSEIVVTSQRRPHPRLLHPGNITVLSSDTLAEVQHQHVQDLLHKVAGVWIVRGSGQEMQTAMRSPVLGGAGSCGGFLVLEDGIPVRPRNFCNVNHFIEVGTEQAQAVEVIRGPANALFGSNALHGVVNVLMPEPDASGDSAALEFGANDYWRIRTELQGNANRPWVASALYAHDAGFRDDSGYELIKVHAKRQLPSMRRDIRVALSATDLRQQSAGFIVGYNAYEDPVLSRSNPTPDAFRDARSIRAYALINSRTGKADVDLRPYLHYSDMTFMHHALPGQPVEHNGQVSGGLMSAWNFAGDRHETVVALDLELADMFLEQRQDRDATGSPRQVETRPVGQHYDYSVFSAVAAAAVQSTLSVASRVELTAGLRLEFASYDYDNHMPDGNTREDGTPCGFGGCLYSRPASRSDTFLNALPNLGASVRIGPGASAYMNLARGYRLPQTLELYRLQNGQQLSDLDPERIDSIEAGIRWARHDLSIDVAAYAMRKRDGVFRDAQGFNVNGARSRHAGIESELRWQAGEHWGIDANVSYGRHIYDFTAAGPGESFTAGNEIDTAPRWLGSTTLRFDPTATVSFGVQLNGVGAYYLEPGNRFRYDGHIIANARASLRAGDNWMVILRVNNLADEAYADRADFAAGDYRYLPGRGREAFVEVRYVK